MNTILYILTSPQPILEGTDAVFQEVANLQQATKGNSINIFPLKKPNSFFPRFLYGWHKLKELKRKEEGVQLNHIYAPQLYNYPILKKLRKKVVYSVIASLKGQKRFKKPSYIAHIIISNPRDEVVLKNWGINNYSIIRPGLKLEGFSPHYQAFQKELILLMASSPWESRQFKTKGVDLLLQSLKALPFLKIIFLWRGFLEQEMLQRIKYYGVEQQIELINKRVNVHTILQKVHGAVLLAATPELVKAYPHSLIETLNVNKPIIISQTIPMADYVFKNNCGLVLEQLSLEELILTIEKFAKNYHFLVQQTQKIPKDDFSEKRMVKEYLEVYHKVLAS